MQNDLLRSCRWLRCATVFSIAGCAGPDLQPVADVREQSAKIVLTSVTVETRSPATAESLRLEQNSARSPHKSLAATQAAAVAADLALALECDRDGRLEEAREAYQRVLRRQPRRADCLHRLAVVCTRLNDFDAARRHFERAESLSPGNHALLIDAGYSRYLAGDHLQAEKLLRKAVQLAPYDVRATNNLAVVLGMTGRYEESLSLFQRVNSPGVAWINLAQIYHARHEPTLALQCCERAQAIDHTIQLPPALASNPQPKQQSPVNAQLPQTVDDTVKTAATVAVEPISTSSSTAPQWVSSPQAKDDDASLPVTNAIHPVADSATPIQHAVVTSQPFEPSTATARSQWTLPVVIPAQVSTIPDEVETEFEVPTNLAAGNPESEFATEDVRFAAKEPVQQPEEPAPAFEAPIWVAHSSPEEQAASEDQDRDLGLSAEAETRSIDDSIDDSPPEPILHKAEYARLVGLSTSDAIKAFCLVTLCDERRLEDAHVEHTVIYRERAYRFATSEEANRFRAAPKNYVPAEEGLDVVARHRGSDSIEGSLFNGVWYRDRLYLFSSQQHKSQFCADVRSFVNVE